jgi:hypothetical protein
MSYYLLDADHVPYRVELDEWARWYETREGRRVGSTETQLYWVSTVFMGLDHNYHPDGPPILFETMVFEREREVVEMPFSGRLVSLHKSVDEDRFFNRYETWAEAETGHAEIVALILKGEAEAIEIMNTTLPQCG